ncbi:MAG: hypothetical protein JO110_08215 [Acetobacteraceae bacterium]|nr:hypothetical protein [Acetobacteraceae bacterium]
MRQTNKIRGSKLALCSCLALVSYLLLARSASASSAVVCGLRGIAYGFVVANSGRDLNANVHELDLGAVISRALPRQFDDGGFWHISDVALLAPEVG